MSAPEQQIESRSSVKISRNAKGEAQFEVKVYDGSTEEELDEVRRIAVVQYEALERELVGVVGSEHRERGHLA